MDLDCPLVFRTKKYCVQKMVNLYRFAHYSQVAIYKQQAELSCIFHCMCQFVNNRKHSWDNDSKRLIAICDFDVITKVFKII